VRVQAAMAFEAAPLPAKTEARDSVPPKRIQTEAHEIAMVRPEVNATLAEYALAQLALPGSRVMEAAHEKPLTIAMVVDVSVAERTLGSMPLTGRTSPNPFTPDARSRNTAFSPKAIKTGTTQTFRPTLTTRRSLWNY